MTAPNPELRVETISVPVPFSPILVVKMVTHAQLNHDGSILFNGFVSLEPSGGALATTLGLQSRDAVKADLLIKLGNLGDAIGILCKKAKPT